MVFRGNRKGISRRQKSVKGRLWKIDFPINCQWGGNRKNTIEPNGEISFKLNRDKYSNPLPPLPLPIQPLKKWPVPKLSTYRGKRLKSNRIDGSKTATINDDSANAGLRLINFNGSCPWGPTLVLRNWFLFKNGQKLSVEAVKTITRMFKTHCKKKFSCHDYKREEPREKLTALVLNVNTL